MVFLWAALSNVRCQMLHVARIQDKQTQMQDLAKNLTDADDQLWFNIFRTVRLRIILVGDQLEAQFILLYIYLNSLHVSSEYVLILRRTIVWIQLLVQLLCVSGRTVCRSRWNLTCIPDGH